MFDCCHKCKPPKRYPGCQDHCPDFPVAKANFEKKKAEYNRARGYDCPTAYAQRVDSIHRAYKKRKGKGKRY